MIEPTENDKSRTVVYCASGGDKVEVGFVTSWNDRFVFVRYLAVLHPHPRVRLGNTSEATSREDLFWDEQRAWDAQKERAARTAVETGWIRLYKSTGLSAHEFVAFDVALRGEFPVTCGETREAISNAMVSHAA